ncbi:MAG: hypothetical protein JXA93_26255, partial [Anaerolineae bacterium]|nr:hypothetical protein [Anaerolineae bacterium]
VEAWWTLDWNDRQWLPMPCEMKRLEPVATQPANHRSRRPARLIYLYALGYSREAILADLKIREQTLAQYFERWIDYGVSGVCGGPCEPSLDEYIENCEKIEAARARGQWTPTYPWPCTDSPAPPTR